MVRIAVVSDIHAYSKARLAEGETKPSWVEVSGPSDGRTSSPFVAVKDLIKREGLSADVLVCAGDLGDKAQPEAITYAWQRVQELQGELGAGTLLVTSGNHDLDSRYKYTDHDARATLQGLPDYPFADEALNNEYWARNVVVGLHDDFRWVVLNSSAFHGFGDEWEHGRISKRTRDYLVRRLGETEQRAINILIVHHHVHKLGGIDLEDSSEMREASALVELLSSGDHGRWLVIHGHQHWPKLSYAGGSRGAPAVFSAGSFSAVLWDELAARARNQFYILDIGETQIGHPIRGTFRAWDWIPDQGFISAKERSGLPGGGGFGGVLNGSELADQVMEFYNGEGAPQHIKFEKVLAAVPDLRFAMPEDYANFVKNLRDKYSVEVLDVNGTPTELGRADH